MAAKTSSVTLGTVLMVASGLVLTLQLILGKALQSAGWPFYVMLSISSAIAFGAFAVLAGLCKAPFPERRSLKWILMRGVSANANLASMIVALRLGAAAGDVAALSSVNTIFAALLGRVFLGEPLQLSHIVSVICCLSGGVLISKPAVLFGNQSSSTPILAYVMAVVSGLFSAVTAISARKAGTTSPWFLNMSATFTGSVFFAVLPFAPFIDEPEIAVLQRSLYLGALCIAATALLICLVIGTTTAGSMLCPAAVSATVNVSARLTLGYLADVVIFGVTVDSLSLCGAALMLVAVLFMACTRRPAAAQEEVAAAKDPETPTGQEPVSATSLEDETESLASFIASEFAAEEGHQSGIHQRKRGAVRDEQDLTQTPRVNRTLFGVSALGAPARVM
eukprot:TRINITY_DN91234_c0_g1_i1.p1 TRINITY_DN91234_c0_g1~~TRINITY_DN91234_c0_g1_i1.p1  ORF type:complete len:393 (+),score=70.95 TRINITY_DN91234_c0_g1_i1:151-1329(+)